MKLFKRNSTLKKCLVLYSFNFDRSQTRKLFDDIANHLALSGLSINYIGYYDERYDDKYEKFDSFKLKMENIDWKQVVNFSLDKDDLRKKIMSLGVEFNITRPVQITLYFDTIFEIDIRGFLNVVSKVFNIDYGFMYYTSEKYWVTSYAVGDWQHIKGLSLMGDLSRKSFENWNQTCEKILQGCIRDVYADNLLKKVHFDRPIGNETFGEFIRKNNLGHIEQIMSDLFYLLLTENDIKIARARLLESDMVLQR